MGRQSTAFMTSANTMATIISFSRHGIADGSKADAPTIRAARLGFSFSYFSVEAPALRAKANDDDDAAYEP